MFTAIFSKIKSVYESALNFVKGLFGKKEVFVELTEDDAEKIIEEALASTTKVIEASSGYCNKDLFNAIMFMPLRKPANTTAEHREAFYMANEKTFNDKIVEFVKKYQKGRSMKRADKQKMSRAIRVAIMQSFA